MLGSIRSKGRPLKFAFLIKANDKKALQATIELNSVLWGGTYNPIVPLFKRKTARWRRDTFKKTVEDITTGYIRAFDPDFLVCDFELPQYIKELGIEVLRPDQILPTKEDPGEFSYGIGLWEILHWVYQDHFRFIQRFPIKVVVPKIPKRDSSFWSSWFGKFPKDFGKDFAKSGYIEAMSVTTPKAKQLDKILSENTIFPRRLMQHGIRTQGRGSFSNENILYYLDPSDFIDVVDFWNLRAVGRAVLPIPAPLKTDASLKAIAKEYIEASRGTHRYNPSLKLRATVIPSSKMTMGDASAFIDSLNLEKDDDGSNPILMQHWYPRIWDDWARGKDSIEPHDIYFEGEKETEINENKSRLTIPISIPDGIKDPLIGSPKFANEISFNVYGDLEKYAEVFPQEHGDNLARQLDTVSAFGEWRIGKNGLVRLASSFRSLSWELPKAEDVFSAWLNDRGWVFELSTAGKLAKVLYKQIEGWTHGFANKEILLLIEEMAKSIDGEGRAKSVAYLKERLKQITGSNRRMEKLLEMNIFTLGINTQCPNCQRNSWFEVDKLNKTLNCPKCLQDFRAIDSVSAGSWSYKTVGPLSVPHHADGAVCVVFSVDFFSEMKMSSIQTTPVYSFNSKKKGSKRKMEADFAFLFRESAWGETIDGVAFGEAKTFNEFKKADFQRMKTIGKEFPGSVLIFSTLRDELTSFEIEELKKLTRFGNKHWKSDRPLNPVLILTGNELMAQFRPPSCWSDDDKKKYRDCRGVLGLAKATQQKYLGIKAWDQVWYEEMEKKRQQREAKKQQNAE